MDPQKQPIFPILPKQTLSRRCLIAFPEKLWWMPEFFEVLGIRMEDDWLIFD